MVDEIANNDGFDSFEEIEAIVRSAGGYVRASDDLRPRVLEVVRRERVERRARRYVHLAAVFLLPMAAAVSSLLHRFDAAVPLRHSLVAVSSEALFLRAQLAVGPVGPQADLGWAMVESVADLRRRQAGAFNLAP
jgi:hypothetical protein